MGKKGKTDNKATAEENAEEEEPPDILNYNGYGEEPDDLKYESDGRLFSEDIGGNDSPKKEKTTADESPDKDQNREESPEEAVYSGEHYSNGYKKEDDEKNPKRGLPA